MLPVRADGRIIQQPLVDSEVKLGPALGAIAGMLMWGTLHGYRFDIVHLDAGRCDLIYDYMYGYPGLPDLPSYERIPLDGAVYYMWGPSADCDTDELAALLEVMTGLATIHPERTSAQVKAFLAKR